MKPKLSPRRALRSASLALLLAGSACIGQAQSFVNPKTFDTGIGSWTIWNGWGLQGSWLTWDSTRDASNNPASGSLRFDVPFTGNSADQFMTFGTLHDQYAWDATTEVSVIGAYQNIAFDFMLDPATAPAKDGTLGTLTIGLVTDGWGTAQQGTYKIPSTATNWTHVTIPIVPTTTGVNKTVGEYINMWSGGNFTNTLSFNVDNIVLEPFPTNAPPVPPPTMGLEKAGPSGVEIIMDGTGDQWNRNALVTPTGGGPYLWTSQGSYPVSYSCTIADFPDIATHPGFEAHMYLVNGDTAGTNNDVSGSPDWAVPDLLIFRVENVAAGGVLAQIQWKTNYPTANATNVPVAVNGTTAVGTWTVTFTDSTDGTLAGPGIAATNFSLPAGAVQSNFSPSTSFVQFGMFKNDGANDGHNNNAHGTYSEVQFTGAQANSFDDKFSGATLTNKYAWRVTDSTAVQFIPPGTAWLVDWTLPAVQFSPETAPAINGPWSPAVFASSYRDSIKMHNLVSQAAVSGAPAGFFRLIKRPFVKLQVLLPGEVAAPGTTTGKTGTPTAQSLGMPFNITVNAVDEVWNVVTAVTDTVDITSSDTMATLPPDAALANGTKQFSISLGTAGGSTITATDVTDPTKTPATSATVQAQ